MNNIDFETDVTFEQRTITPEDAHEMLTHNTMNRNIDWKRVEKYAFDMKSGAWNMNGSTSSGTTHPPARQHPENIQGRWR